MDSIAQAEGIDYGSGNPARVLVRVWMLDWSTLWHTSIFWPRACGYGCGSMQICTYFTGEDNVGDITMPAVLLHEAGHAACAFHDHYPPGGNFNNDDIMSNGGNNHGGWTTPYFTAPDCHNHGYWPVQQVRDLADVGNYVLRPFESLFWENPFSAPCCPERVYLCATPNVGGNTGINFTRPIRMTVFRTFPDDSCGRLNMYWVQKQSLYPADGIPDDSGGLTTDDGDLFPYGALDSVTANWVQSWGTEQPIPMGWRARNIRLSPDTVGTDSILAFDLAFVAPPAFLVEDFNDELLQLGTPWTPHAKVVNWGGEVTNPSFQFTSLRSDALSTFTINYPGTITALDTVELVAEDPITPSGAISHLGAIVPLVMTTAQWADTDSVALHLTELTNAITDEFSVVQTFAAYDNVLAVASVNSLYVYVDFERIWARGFTNTIESVAIGDLAATADSTPEIVCAIRGGSVHVLDDNGFPLDRWPLTDLELAEPGVILAPVKYGQLHVCVVNGDELWVLNGLKELAVEQREVTPLPGHPERWCYVPDSLFGQLFAFTTGADSVSGMFFLADWLGHLIYPDSAVGINPEYGYGQPISVDVNGDGHLEIVVPYVNTEGHGGLETISFSQWFGRYGSGTLAFPGSVRFDGLAASRWETEADAGARIVASSYGATSSDNLMLIGGDVNVRFAADQNRRHPASFDIDGSGHGQVVVASGSQVLLLGPSGGAVFPNATTCAAAMEGSGCLISPFSIRGAGVNMSNLGVLVSDSSAGSQRFRFFGTGGLTADWSGPLASAQNQSRHPYLGEVPDCLSPDTLTLVATRLDTANLLLRWEVCGHLNWAIEGYHVYWTTHPDSAAADSEFVASTERYGGRVLSLDAIPLFRHYYVKAELSVSPPSGDGSEYWGEHSVTP